eukprot:tig00020904_g15201.t1
MDRSSEERSCGRTRPHRPGDRCSGSSSEEDAIEDEGVAEDACGSSREPRRALAPSGGAEGDGGEGPERPLEAVEVPRYLRFNPRDPPERAALEAQLGPLREVPWLRGLGFYEAAASAQLAGADAYARGQVYGIDAASGAAVALLDPRPGERVLDLCCAPGAKASLIADLVAPHGVVVGVDVSARRMAACRSLLLRYRVANARLYLADGTTFAPPKLAARGGGDHRAGAGAVGEPLGWMRVSPGPIAIYAPAGSPAARATAKRNKKARHRARAALEEASRLEGEGGGPGPGPGGEAEEAEESFDKVLVDAECTHDGSHRHVAKLKQQGPSSYERWLTDPARVASLESLQRSLLANGFRLLAPGGTLVYSTCSYARRQNEDVVRWFLEREPRAKLQDARALGSPAVAAPARDSPHLPGTLRFDPRVSKTSGLFVARLVKEGARRL